jgi:hypothetical protein
MLMLPSSLNANCLSNEYLTFDFWLGNWQVSTAEDNIIRNSRVTKINDGCTLLEEYSTPSGYKGKSLNIYNKQTQEWHQTWTDNNGLLLQLNGNIVGNSMVMLGQTIDERNKNVINKITWTPKAKGTVRQFWQTSHDNGKTWQTLFDGLYTQRP